MTPPSASQLRTVLLALRLKGRNLRFHRKIWTGQRHPISVCIACLIILGVVFSGCSGYRQVWPGSSVQRPVTVGALSEVLDPGDTVRITTLSGEEIRGTLESLEEGAMVVSGQRIQYSPIRSLLVRGILWKPTAIFVVGATWTGLVLTAPDATYSTE